MLILWAWNYSLCCANVFVVLVILFCLLIVFTFGCSASVEPGWLMHYWPAIEFWWVQTLRPPHAFGAAADAQTDQCTGDCATSQCVVCNVVWAYMCVQIYFIYGFYGCFLPRSIFIIEVTGASCHMDSILVTLWFGIRSPVAQMNVYCSSGFVCWCLFPNQIKSELCPPNYFSPTIAIKYQVNII